MVCGKKTSVIITKAGVKGKLGTYSANTNEAGLLLHECFCTERRKEGVGM